MPQLHSQRMHAVAFHPTPGTVAVSVVIDSSTERQIVSFRYSSVYSEYHAVNGFSVDASLSPLLPRGPSPGDHWGAVVPVDRPRSPGGSAPLQRSAPLARHHAEVADRTS